MRLYGLSTKACIRELNSRRAVFGLAPYMGEAFLKKGLHGSVYAVIEGEVYTLMLGSKTNGLEAPEP